MRYLGSALDDDAHHRLMRSLEYSQVCLQKQKRRVDKYRLGGKERERERESLTPSVKLNVHNTFCYGYIRDMNIYNIHIYTYTIINIHAFTQTYIYHPSNHLAKVTIQNLSHDFCTLIYKCNAKDKQSSAMATIHRCL